LVNQLTSVAFFISVLSLTVFDRKRLNTLLTPFTITAWPFVVIILSVNFALIHIQFPPVTIRVQLFILSNLILLWAVGFIISYLYKVNDYKSNRVNYSQVFKEFVRFDLFLISLSMILVIVILNHTYTLLQKYGGWSFIGDQRFEEMIIVGPVAHLVQVAKVCFLFLFFLYKKSKHKILIIITLAGLFLAIASIQVKYHLIWMLIFGFLYNTLDKSPRRQMRSIIWIAIILFLLMNMFWITLTLAWGTFDVENPGIWEFLGKQFLNYFVSGTISLDQWLNWPGIKPDWTLFIVFMNIYYVIMGYNYRITFVPYVTHGFLETAPGVYGNVGTSYGVYYLIGGIPLTYAVTVGLGFITYIIFYKSRQRGTPILLYLNMLFLTLSLLSFFGQYFTLLSLYEMTAIFLIFIFIFKIINSVYETKFSVDRPELIS
jgi:hypothetical protein